MDSAACRPAPASPFSYCTFNVTLAVRVTLPEVPETVTVYVPAGVPEVEGVVLFELPHPACKPNDTKARVNAASMMIRLRRLAPIPMSAKPPTGRSITDRRKPGDFRAAVVTGLATVVTVREEVTGVPFGTTGLVENLQLTPCGSPEQVNDTELL
jgi:hypothetical protein